MPGGRTWLIAFGAIGLVSLLDDWRGVSAPSRLLVHAAAAFAIVHAMFDPGIDPGAAEWLVTGIVALALVWSANLFNFMDGSDGLAATAALVGFAVYAAAGALTGNDATLCLALAAAIVPFLAVNVPPARMFMGDVGSAPLGFLAGTFGIVGVWRGTWPAWFPLLVFLPLVADASLTLARRFFRGERVGLPHRSHYYQRFNRLGAGHRGTCWLYGGLCTGCGASALGVLLVASDFGWTALFAWAGVVAVIFAGIDYHWKRFTRAAP
jgi:UDP-N-acetylmuramyl pentapeptide phosphotransferase/UDP-N-acetylglucosamine-1-phosphate transferase